MREAFLLYTVGMKSSRLHLKNETGNALVAVILIIFVTLIGGIYFWNNTKAQIEAKRIESENAKRAAASAILSEDFWNDDGGEKSEAESSTEIKSIEQAVSNLQTN